MTELFYHLNISRDATDYLSRRRTKEVVVFNSEHYVGPPRLTASRYLSDTESSYFLPSRDDGVNDMYLHLGGRAPAHVLQNSRVALVWAVLRMRHPLLCSAVVMKDYERIKFVWTAPSSSEAVLKNAVKNLEYRSQTKDELIDSYLNGPRTLSNNRLSYLIFSKSPNAKELQNFEFLMCATHFLGDGMALHQFANDFFGLLGGGLTQDDLTRLLHDEWLALCANDVAPELPVAMEERLPRSPRGKLREAVEQIDFQLHQGKHIGGHAFPRRSKMPRRTVVPTVSFDSEATSTILKNCKSHGVSISSALFAVCNLSWAITQPDKWELPMMMYSAMNMRPYLVANNTLNNSYWFLAVGYFNIVLPSFYPKASAGEASIFWQRARSAKAQSAKVAKSSMVVSRCRQMARERGERARGWAKLDDEIARGIPQVAPSVPIQKSESPPSTALLGLSLLGNLDGIYKHASFPSIQLHALTTGSRQRCGGMLLFGYTFAGKLWLSFGYDENGFEREVVEKFWQNVLATVTRMLAVVVV